MICRLTKFLLKIVVLVIGHSFVYAQTAPGGDSKAGDCRPNEKTIYRSQTGANPPANFFAFSVFPGYLVNLSDWGPDPGTLTQWINSPRCWEASTTTQIDGGIKSYPHASLGWSNNAAALDKMSSSGFPKNPNWTTKSGLGLPVLKLPPVSVFWEIAVPSAVDQQGKPLSRWMALIDVYFHSEKQGAPNPPATAWPPQADIQIMQMIMDHPLRGQRKTEAGYYAYRMSHSNYFIKTIASNTYIGVVDMDNYNAPGGHTVTLMALPTMVTNQNMPVPVLWGQVSMRHRVDELIAWLSQPMPTDDSGKRIKNAKGDLIDEPVIHPSWYLTSINAGFEISFGSPADGNNRWLTKDYSVSIGDKTRP